MTLENVHPSHTWLCIRQVALRWCHNGRDSVSNHQHRFVTLENVHPSHTWLCIRQVALRWCHNGRDSVSNHQHRYCLLKRLFRRKSKKTSKLRVTGLCAGNSPGTGEFPAQRASNAENVSIWWRHRVPYLIFYHGVVITQFSSKNITCMCKICNTTSKMQWHETSLLKKERKIFSCTSHMINKSWNLVPVSTKMNSVGLTTVACL